MNEYKDWERGIAIGMILGSVTGFWFTMITLAMVVGYDVYGERAKFILANLIDGYLPVLEYRPVRRVRPEPIRLPRITLDRVFKAIKPLDNSSDSSSEEE